MHELSIASAIVAEVRDAMVANDVQSVSEVTVKIGRLSGIVADALEFGWEIVRQGTVLADTSITIIDEPVVVWCPVGDHALELDGMIFRCEQHDCATPEILSGERLEILRFTVGAPPLDDSGTTETSPTPEAAA